MSKYRGNWTDIFRSKRFIAAFVGLLVMILVGLFPDLESSQDTIIEAVVVVVGVLIGGYSVQDAIATARDKRQE